MPSIQDVADQLNAKLDSINEKTSNTAANTANLATLAGSIRDGLIQANDELATIDGVLQVGLVNLSQGLAGLYELEMASIALLDHHRKQNDTIICLLENSNALLYGITRQLTRQLELSAATLKSVARSEGIDERVHPGEAADYDRQLALRAQIEDCCPPRRERPEAGPPVCEKPDFVASDLSGIAWKPLSPPGGSKVRVES